MVRDLYNVRVRPVESATALTDEEEQRFQAMLFNELGNTIAEHGWARYPAYTREDRRRLATVAQHLTLHWGRQVLVEAEDLTRVRLSLAGHETLPKTTH